MVMFALTRPDHIAAASSRPQSRATGTDLTVVTLDGGSIRLVPSTSHKYESRGCQTGGIRFPISDQGEEAGTSYNQ